MKMRRCGTSALELPVLGIGCWSFGGGDYWGEQDQGDVDAIVSAALESGCGYFDTAEVYNEGRSESSLGMALRGRRSRAVIGTKVSPHNTAPDVLRRHCEDSLRRLRTDYIDLYMVHWPIHSHALRHYTEDVSLIDSPPDTGDAFDELSRLREEGKIREIGVSNFGVTQLGEIAQYGISANQVCYNLLTRGIEFEILPACRDAGVGLIGYMPLMQGILTGKYRTLDEIPPQRTRTRHFSGARPSSRHGEAGFEGLLAETLEILLGIAHDAAMPLMELSLAWSIANTAVSCTINGVRSAEQLSENVKAAGTVLSSDLLSDLDRATLALKDALGPNPDLFEAKENSRVF